MKYGNKITEKNKYQLKIGSLWMKLFFTDIYLIIQWRYRYRFTKLNHYKITFLTF